MLKIFAIFQGTNYSFKMKLLFYNVECASLTHMHFFLPDDKIISRKINISI